MSFAVIDGWPHAFVISHLTSKLIVPSESWGLQSALKRLMPLLGQFSVLLPAFAGFSQCSSVLVHIYDQLYFN